MASHSPVQYILDGFYKGMGTLSRARIHLSPPGSRTFWTGLWWATTGTRLYPNI